MCFFRCLRGISGAGQAICGCFTGLVIVGPILIIVGIVLLAVKNTRADDIAAYNKAVAAYNGTTVNSWLPGTVVAPTDSRTLTFSSITNVVPIDGNAIGVAKATSTVLSAVVSGNPGTFTVSLNNVTAFQRVVPATTYYGEYTVQCRDAAGCSRADMVNQCSGSYIGSGCSSAGDCGTCTQYNYLYSVCVVVTSSPPYTEDSTLSSCYYPFGTGADSQKYNTNYNSGYVVVQVMKSDDPFIALQRITKGSENFGTTAAQQHNIGLACLIIGSILTAFSVCTGCCLRRMVKRATANTGYQLPQQYGQQGYPLQQGTPLMPSVQGYPQQQGFTQLGGSEKPVYGTTVV